MYKIQKYKKAFTLMEIMIVMLIIGIGLMGLTPKFTSKSVGIDPQLDYMDKLIKAEWERSIELGQPIVITGFKGSANLLNHDKETKTIEYVGRTTNLKYTEERHARNPFRTSLKIDPIATNVSKETARGLEQMWILQCHTLNKNKEFPKNNQINGVASNNPQYNLFWDMALEWESENEHLIPCP